MIGKTLSHYEIKELLGKGGMAEVYRARDTRLDRDVALKILPPEFTTNSGRLRRFEREAIAASALSHPHLAHIYDVGHEDGVHFYAMEIIEGETLDQRSRRQELTLDEILRIGAQVSAALAALHECEVLHRDLKPGNIMLDGRGDVKIVDFGLAKCDAAEQASPDLTVDMATRDGTVLGTLHYMSPEQARGETVDTRADIFSLGVILYELSTGERPFEGRSAIEVLTQLATHDPPQVTELRPALPAELARIIRKCLHKDADMRFASAADLKVDLDNLRAPSQSAVSPPPPAAARKRRSRWLSVAVVLAVVLSVALVTMRMRSDSGAEIASIAVLPFANTSQSADLGYLCDGLAEGLINSLAQGTDLRVISRLSSFRFRDTTADLGEIGKALGVEAVVVGRLTAQGDEISLSAELVDVRDSRQIWGDRYSQADQDILALEKQLARAISAELRPRAIQADDASLRHRPAQDAESYRLYLKAREIVVGTQAEMHKGIELLEMAIARSPDYALAYCALAEAHLWLGDHGVEGEAEALATARSAVSEALKIDPDLAEAHSLLGSIAWNFDWDWAASDRHHRKALDLDPRSLAVNLRYSETLTAAGRWEEAAEIAREAKQIDPLSTRATHWLGFSLLGGRQFDEAAVEFRSAIDLNPSWIWGYIKMSRALAQAGHGNEAVAAARTADQRFAGDDTPLARGWITETYLIAGADSLAQDSLRQLLAKRDKGQDINGALMQVYLTMGRTDEALALLEQAYEIRSEDAAWILAYPGLNSPELAQHPRFRRLVRLMGLDGSS